MLLPTSVCVPRATGRGALRLRFEVAWTNERARLLGYAAIPPPTFVVPFNARAHQRDAAFAVHGRKANPGAFLWRTFNREVRTQRLQQPWTSAML